MRFGAGIGSIMLLAVIETASAQPFPDPSTLDATQLRGRDIFNQSCLVCHVKLQITSAAKYGPDLSKEALGGQEAVMAVWSFRGEVSLSVPWRGAADA